ncbi:MAG: 2-hydroxyacyl-CoA dehydratase [Candidatus Brocadia sp. AMX2]|uniref:2-hydroxyglutaryl-CoA dehydratase D-component n=1 Tax=Candidatus Brocadia sinica JPN1 TaxID=1197129 RepID=A0ABQ0JUE4_9BACT|nr:MULTISPECIES: 2-hydroxyacyl-CoA dehydratase family protein [Brocadia]MBC6932993.1 2-hydroxyacyl-CoA dehydratase [Candidatus Brocadia sp.]MBL1169299.1 2-hydroxyacyl-CoA dehydratase [Candidatus Brocadia sp. AMX1]NOG41802.1 2-hydroxyacyl-CoA dehydratase [Planctomycetota bacterium]GIK14139.1 MAG: 2-hydroxyglutaryl-CoA dehydratase [Candidatus Brocadia sinica]KAA0241937.1 MAG: 2-hydroxyacyl-CoA dehydratase [Candidatus Brocadia sp. AMX2]
MASIRKFKEWTEPFLRRISPILFRELLRFLKIYYFFCRGNKKKELVSLHVQTRVGVKHLYNAFAHPKRTVWTTMFVPSEILFPMGLYPFCLEIGAALFAGLGQSSRGLMEAESYGVPTDICSFHRSAIGHTFRNLFPKNILQVATTTLCDNNTKTMKICESVTGKETIVIDVPYEADDYSVKYLTKQLEDFTQRLEEATGRKMDQAAFEKAIEYSNQTREKMIEINELRKDPDCPLQGSNALGFMFPGYLLIGSQLSVEFFSSLAAELREKIEEKKRNVNRKSPRDQIRILWLELKPYFKIDFLTKLEQEQGVKIVFEETNYVYWDKLDPQKPYESLARKLITSHYNGPLERRIEVTKKLAREYQVDGVVVFSSWGCRRNNAAVPTLKRELNKIGYPLLSLDGDCVDDHNYMPGQFSTRIEGFLEMLRGRKATTNISQREMTEAGVA